MALCLQGNRQTQEQQTEETKNRASPRKGALVVIGQIGHLDPSRSL
jgi:hypothetical protein